jgi:PAS domain S-box-containing protein
MTDTRERALLDEAGPPAWLFDPASERIVAANKAALAFFGETSLFALAERSFAPDAPFLVFAREVMGEGTPKLKRIAFPEASAGTSEALRLEPMRMPGGAPGLLAELHPWRAQAADPQTLRLADALAALPSPVLLARSDGAILFTNDAANRLLGNNEGDLTARLGFDAAKAIGDGLAARGHVSRALDLALGAARRRCHIEARRLRDPIIGVPLDLVLLRDISGIAQLEALLAAERRTLRALLALAADFTWESDAEGRFTTVSAGFATMLGLPGAILIGKALGQSDAVLSVDDGAANLFAAVPDRFDDLPFSLLKGPRQRVEFTLSGQARRHTDGSFAGYRGVGWRSEAQAQAPAQAPRRDAPLARHLAAIVNAAQDTLMVLGADGRIRFANKAAETLFDVPRGALEGQTLLNLLAPQARAGLLHTPPSRMLAETIESRIRLKTGTEKLVQLSIRPLDKADPSTLCVALHDITAYKTVDEDLVRARDAALAANRQKTEFLARVSHELRTPLNAIIGFSEIMRDEQLGPMGNERYAGYVRDIHHSGHLLLSLVNDLIDLSKVESGRFTLKFGSVDVGRVLGRAVQLMEPAAQKAGITLDGRVGFNLPSVLADERSLEQIILNLLSNAIKFTKRGGRVTAMVGPTPDGGVALSVRDTGIGMSAADLKTALEPFQRVDRPDVAEKPGTGLGLPIAKALTEANNAQFLIQSEPKEGTAVVIAFPKTRVAGSL